MTGAGQENDADAVLYRTEGPVAIITLNRPDQRNSVNAAFADGLRAGIRRFEADPALRVAVLCGRGKVFCAGMDLKALSDPASRDAILGEGRFGGFVSLERTKPVIAAVHGAALAGGFEIMLACDMAIAERGTKFGLPEPKVGLLAAAGGIFRLAMRIPPAKAREYVLTGKMFSTDEAEAFGLLNAVVEEGKALETSLALAAEIASCAPQAVEYSLRLARQAEQQAEVTLWPESDALLTSILATDDAREGASAFVEKRAPVWSGR